MRYSKELCDMMELTPVTRFVKGQRIQWLRSHIMRRGENKTVRIAMEWKPQGRRPRGRPRNRWIVVVKENL